MVLLDAVLLLILMTSRFGVRKRRRRCVAMTMPRRPVAGLLVIRLFAFQGWRVGSRFQSGSPA
jgi:hypothetical protein